MAPTPARESIPIIQAKAPERLAPSVLVYATTREPDFRFKEKGEFYVKAGYNDVRREALEAQVQKFMDDNHEALEKEAGKKLKRKSAKSFLEDKLQPPHEKSAHQVPTLKIARQATYVDKKTGETKRMDVSYWDKDGNKLDPEKLRTGSGSIIQPVVTMSLYSSGLTKGYAEVAFRLEGLIVLKNEAWGGGSQGPGDAGSYDEAQLAELLGEDVEVEDLSAFAASAPSKEAPAEKAAPEDDGYDPADDIPL